MLDSGALNAGGITACGLEPGVFVVGPDSVGTEAIARSLNSISVGARSASASEAAEAVTNSNAAAVVLVSGLGLDPGPLLLAMTDRSIPLIIVTANGAIPPATSHLRPIVVMSLNQLLDTARELVHHVVDQRRLTDRHIEILQHLANGSTPLEASTELGITIKTLNNHLGVIYRRMGAKNVTQALLLALRLGIISLP